MRGPILRADDLAKWSITTVLTYADIWEANGSPSDKESNLAERNDPTRSQRSCTPVERQGVKFREMKQMETTETTKLTFTEGSRDDTRQRAKGPTSWIITLITARDQARRVIRTNSFLTLSITYESGKLHSSLLVYMVKEVLYI